MKQSLAWLLGGAAGLAVLALGAAWLARAGDRAAPAAGERSAAGELAALADSVAALRGELAAARASDEALAEEIDRLWQALGDRAGVGAHAEPGAAPGEEGAAAEAGAGFDEAAFAAAGFDPRDVAAIREELDAIALDRIHLRDTAVREGWLGTPRWRRENRALDQAFLATRAEFGDELFDWAMYATERPNRVLVAGVLQGSAAAAAGIRPGDVILSYGDSRVFQIRDLRTATAGGRAGETTPVDVLRDGETRRVNVPRGPLGITPEPRVLRPAPTG